MIYLIRVDYKDFSLAKIGYAKNIKKRFSNYRTENPMAELIAYREGSSEEEKLFHLAFFLRINLKREKSGFIGKLIL